MAGMKTTATSAARFLAVAILAAAGRAFGGEGSFQITVDSPRPASSEDVAVHGFVMLDPGASGTRAVGTVGRAYSMSPAADNTVWGLVSEAINFPGAQGNVVGTESGVVSMSHDNAAQLRGIDVVFKNRLDSDIDNPVPVLGQNHYNENSAALFVSSQPRSPAGEYSGWQSGIKFSRDSLDRSASKPYAAAIDISDAQVSATLYLLVWRCGTVKCGLKPTIDGMTLVTDIDRAPG